MRGEESKKVVAVGPVEDLLESRRLGGDFAWARQTWRCPDPSWSSRRSPQRLKEAVLESDRVRAAIARAARDTGRSENDVHEEVRKTMDVLAHKFKMPVIRLWGYALAKVFKRLYSGILVDVRGVRRFQENSVHCPVLLLPTHRSYVDFLLLSYVSFHMGAPLPCAAAGTNMLGLAWASGLLRHAGGFFIRRRFGADPLYWATVTEYLHQILLDGRHPIEVFVEGARSRTGKSLLPKAGFVKACLELYYAKRVPDIILIPVSMTYDRLLEENLYACEMLGVPKPEENVAGLVKSRSIFNDVYGNVYVRFGPPISIKDTVGAGTMTVSRLLCHVIKEQQKATMSSHFPLACLILSHYVHCRGSALDLGDLTRHFQWLTPLVSSTGAKLLSKPTEDWVVQQTKLHSNFVQVRGDSLVLIPVKHGTTGPLNGTSKAPITLSHILLQQYSNEALQLIEPFCKVAVCLTLSNDPGIQLEKFGSLNRLLQTEFVYQDWKEEDVFSEALEAMRDLNIVGSEEKMSFLVSCLQPFLNGMSAVVDHLLQRDSCESLDRFSACQGYMEEQVNRGRLVNQWVLSLDFIRSCHQCLVLLGAVRTVGSGECKRYNVDAARLKEISSDLRTFQQDGTSSKKYETTGAY